MVLTCSLGLSTQIGGVQEYAKKGAYAYVSMIQREERKHKAWREIALDLDAGNGRRRKDACSLRWRRWWWYSRPTVPFFWGCSPPELMNADQKGTPPDQNQPGLHYSEGDCCA